MCSAGYMQEIYDSMNPEDIHNQAYYLKTFQQALITYIIDGLYIFEINNRYYEVVSEKKPYIKCFDSHMKAIDYCLDNYGERK